MINGTTEDIYIRSEIKNSKIFLNERYIGKENVIIPINKKDNYFIKVSKNGCKDNIVKINRSFDPLSLLGIFVDWGIISIFIVDWASTGAITKANQVDYTIDPEC